MRTVIFDLDGTLADTSGDLIAAANSCFETLGLGALLDPVGDAPIALKGGRAMLAAGFARTETQDTSEIDRQYPHLLESYRTNIDRHTVFFDGAMEAVEALKSRGFRVGVCTNKPEGLADLLLKRLGVRDAFHSMIGADTLPVRKPNPAPFVEAVRLAGGSVERSILIGDTITDLDTARAAQVPCVLVTFGPSGPASAALGPDALLDHFDALPGLAESLLGAS